MKNNMEQFLKKSSRESSEPFLETETISEEISRLFLGGTISELFSEELLQRFQTNLLKKNSEKFLTKPSEVLLAYSFFFFRNAHKNF